MIKRIRVFLSFFGLDGQMKKDVVSIVLIYFRVSFLVRCYPLSKYYHKYFLHDHAEPFDFAPCMKELSLVRKVIKQMPGKPSCLKESIIVHLFFKRKGIYIPIYLGVNTEKEFLAHAWYDQRGSKGYHQVNAV
ncbi:MAG: lasso peptide biosynthesis B2 protein [Bacteroidales bacterium]